MLNIFFDALFLFNHYLIVKKIILLHTIIAIGFIGTADAENEIDSTYYKRINRINVNNRIAEYFLNQQPELSILYADSAINNALDLNFNEGLWFAYEIKAKALLTRGNYKQALRYTEKNLDLASHAGNHHKMAISYFAIGDIFFNLQKNEEALENFRRACKNLKDTIDPVMEARIFAGLWDVFLKLRQADSASYYQKRVLDVFKQYQSDAAIVNQLNVIGNSMIRHNNLQEALDYYQNALEINESKGNQVYLIQILDNLGEIYLLQEKPAQALRYFSESLKLKKEQKLIKAQIESLLGISSCLAGLTRYSALLDTAHSMEILAEKLGSLQYLLEVYFWKSEAYEAQNDLANSNFYLKKRNWLADSLFGLESAAQLAQLTANYEFNEKEREIELLAKEKALLKAESEINKLEIRNKSFLIFGLLIFFVAGGFFSFFIWKRYQEKKRDNQIISKQYQQIRIQKEKVEEQRDIIEGKKKELENAQKIIKTKNQELQKHNVRLEDLVQERSRELNLTYQRLSNHIENAPLAILEWNSDLKLNRWSGQAERIFELPASAVLHKNLGELPIFSAKSRRKLKRLFEQLFEGKTPRDLQKILIQLSSGKILTTEWSNSVIYDEQGKFESILSIINDVSDREKAFQNLKDTNRDLDNFIYRASHDLKGPLARMEGVIQLGKIEATEKVSQNYFEMLNRENTALSAILKRLMQVYEFHQKQPQFEDVFVLDEIKKVVDAVSARQKIKPVQFDFKIQKDLQWSTDRGMFSILIEKMLFNSSKYLQNGHSRITFSTFRENGTLKLVISDNGVGIADQAEDRIFDVFYRGTDQSDDDGLDLYMARKLTEQLGGGISLVKPINDTTYEILLPAKISL